MSLRITTLFLLSLAVVVSSAHAASTIVNDDFESYPSNDNSATLYTTWEPRNGIGNGPPFNTDDGILTADDALFPGIQGQGVDHLGGSVLQHTGLTPAAPIFPSATESIHVQSDIFVGNDGNARMTMGLRNRTSTVNIIELGTYNSKLDSFNPFEDGGDVPEATTYGYRLRVFDLGGDMVQTPNWYFFQFDLALDIDDSDPETADPTPDGLVSPADIGAGWHTYSATITPDTITVAIDLYRDGLDNGATITAGSDVAGIDASVTYDLITRAQGYDSFRLGSASGISSANGVGFDNVSLELVDVVVGGGSDADGDGDVDGADFLKLQRDDPSGIAQWELDYPSPLQGISAVPEPGTLSLVLLAAAGLLASRRR